MILLKLLHKELFKINFINKLRLNQMKSIPVHFGSGIYSNISFIGCISF